MAGCVSPSSTLTTACTSLHLRRYANLLHVHCWPTATGCLSVNHHDVPAIPANNSDHHPSRLPIYLTILKLCAETAYFEACLHNDSNRGGKQYQACQVYMPAQDSIISSSSSFSHLLRVFLLPHPCFPTTIFKRRMGDLGRPRTFPSSKGSTPNESDASPRAIFSAAEQPLRDSPTPRLNGARSGREAREE